MDANLKHITKTIALRVAFVLLSLLTIVVVIMSIQPSAEQPSGKAGSAVISASENVASPKPLEVAVMKLDGTWVGEMNDAKFNAVVANQVITIQVTNNGTTMTYWCGSFNTEESPGNIITSNVIDTGKAVLSSAVTKPFLVRSNSLSFEFKIMGSTTNVELFRV